MKILIVNDYSELIGGVETYINYYSEELLRRGYTIKKYSSNSLPNNNTYNHIKLFTQLFNIKSYLNFKKVLKEFKPDIIHIHSIYNELSPSILLTYKNIPTFMTIHNYQLTEIYKNNINNIKYDCNNSKCNKCFKCLGLLGVCYQIFKNIIYRILLKKVNYFLCPSNFIKNKLSLIGIHNTILIVNGVKLYKPKKIMKYNSLLFVGRLEAPKGIYKLLKAFIAVKKEMPDTKLTIIGDGKEKKQIAEFIKDYKLKDSVNLIGWVSSKKIYKYYKDSTILIMPSIWEEPFGLVGVEAMSVGRVVIATNVGGIPEWLNNNETGLLIDKKDLDNLDLYILSLLRNKKNINRMGKNSIEKSKKFSIANHVDKLESIFIKNIKKTTIL